ncbi:MAG: ABC transporter substrate-binding protein [Alphaproteobacteria bacterium]
MDPTDRPCRPFRGAVLAVVLAGVLAVAPTAPLRPAGAEDLSAPVVRVSVLSIVDHPRFDAMRLGMTDRLQEAQAQMAGRLALERVSADADLARLGTEAKRLAQSDARVIVALSAPAARALAALPIAKPVVFAAVAPEEAGAIVATRKAVTVIGIVEQPPEGEQIALIQRILPAVRRLIVPFEANRPDGQVGARNFAALASARGYGPVLRPVDPAAADPLAGVSGTATAIMLLPALLGPEMEDALLASAERQALPAFGGDAGSVARGTLATVTHDAYATGRVIGDAVLALLTQPGGQKTELREATAGHIVINLDSAGRLGRALPASVLERAGTLIDSADGNQPRPAAKPAAPPGRRRVITE